MDNKTYLKGGLTVYQTKYTFDELKELRANTPPQDLWEMTVVEGLCLKEINNVINGEYAIHFDGQTRRHVQPYVFQGIYHLMNSQSYQSMKLSSNLSSTNLDAIRDDSLIAPLIALPFTNSDQGNDRSFAARELSKSSKGSIRSII
jgi:hypothetical protein